MHVAPEQDDGSVTAIVPLRRVRHYYAVSGAVGGDPQLHASESLIHLGLVAGGYHARVQGRDRRAIPPVRDRPATRERDGRVRRGIHEEPTIGERRISPELLDIRQSGPSGHEIRRVVVLVPPLAQREVIDVVRVVVFQRAVDRMGLEGVPKRTGADSPPGHVEVRVVRTGIG